MISLVISVFNRTELLRKNLLRFKFVTLPDEIIIVDDGTHNQHEVPDMLKKLDFIKGRIKYIRHNNLEWDSCSIPKNIGLKNATGNILIYTEPENIFIEDVVKLAKSLSFCINLAKIHPHKAHQHNLDSEWLHRIIDFDYETIFENIDKYGWVKYNNKVGQPCLYGLYRLTTKG